MHLLPPVALQQWPSLGMPEITVEVSGLLEKSMVTAGTEASQLAQDWPFAIPETNNNMPKANTGIPIFQCFFSKKKGAGRANNPMGPFKNRSHGMEINCLYEYLLPERAFLINQLRGILLIYNAVFGLFRINLLFLGSNKTKLDFWALVQEENGLQNFYKSAQNQYPVRAYRN